MSSPSQSTLITTALAAALIISFSIKLSAAIDDDKVTELANKLLTNEVTYKQETQSATNLLTVLQEREKQMSDWEKQLEHRESALKDFSEDLKKQIDELEDAEIKLNKQIENAKRSSQRDVEKVTTLYEKMKPKEASAIFELMETSLAAGILSGMDEEQASSILSRVSPEKSYAISVYIAGRNAHQ